MSPAAVISTAAGTRTGRGSTHYTRRSTDDRDEAEQVIADLYLPNRLDLSRGSAPLGMEVTGLRLRALTVARVRTGARSGSARPMRRTSTSTSRCADASRRGPGPATR